MKQSAEDLPLGRPTALSVVTLDRSVHRLLCGCAIGDGVKSRWLPWTGGPAPMDHVTVISAVSVQR